MVLPLHGVLGNLLDETEHFLPTALADRGYASISFNTALANLGLFYGFGVFDDVIPQIDAVCDFLLAEGLTKVVLAGHGLGAAMAVRYVAVGSDPVARPETQGVVAIAVPIPCPKPSAGDGIGLVPNRAIKMGRLRCGASVRVSAGRFFHYGLVSGET